MQKTYGGKLSEIIFVYCLLSCVLGTVQCSNTYQNGTTVDSFGHWSISKECFDYIRSVVPNGGTVLEFGSGWATGQLSKHYMVYSVENDKRWIAKYDANYLYAPIVNGWYDRKVLDKLPKHYDVLLIDGPLGRIGRRGILKYLDLLNLNNVLIVVDDVHRPEEYDLLEKLAEALACDFEVHPGAGQLFGVIYT